MQKSFWWWQCSNRYIISLSPHLHTPFPSSSLSLISCTVSVDVMHIVYLLAYSAGWRCEEKKSCTDTWMSEQKVYCKDGWMFVNKCPTLMCLTKTTTTILWSGKKTPHFYLTFMSIHNWPKLFQYLSIHNWPKLFQYLSIHNWPKLFHYLSAAICLGAGIAQWLEHWTHDR